MTIRLRKQWFLVGLLLLLSGPLAAQHGPLYWNADTDSLRRVLATQRADTARLRTLLHLTDLSQDESSDGQRNRDNKELADLTSRLHHPSRRAYHLVSVGRQLADSLGTAAAGLDSLQAAVTAFDALRKPMPELLTSIRTIFNTLNLQEGRRAFYEAKLAYYQKRGARENMAACYHGLGGYYAYRGDYNQAISYYLRAADLYRGFYLFLYRNELKVIGSYYALWGNQPKAIYYLRSALSARDSWNSRVYIYRNLGGIYLQQRNFPAALRYANQALANTNLRSEADTARLPQNKAYGLVMKSAVFLAQHRVAEAGRLLVPAQHLADSLHLPLVTSDGNFELDATWARYYTAHGEPARAEAYWRTAYRKAIEIRSAPLRLDYLRALAVFYQQRGQSGPAATYALAAVSLADTLDASQGAFHVAQYELERADQAQIARIARMRQAQAAEAVRAHRQRRVLWAVLGGAGLLVLLASVLYYAFRRSERLKQLVTNQKHDIQTQRDQLNSSLTDLRATQAQLIQKEKMASLGELTAGIAHEIQNPLNFVNNFADVSAELMQESREAQAAGDAAEVAALTEDVIQNLTKIHQHGQRAAGIVRGMLEHSRQSSGERAPTDLNALADEYLRLAYHGLRAKDKTFNATLETDFAPALPLVEGVGADLGRVLLNLFNNAFYAVQQRQQTGEAGYAPTVSISTTQVGQQVEIRVSDNGTGMSPEVQAKIFQPFFTTKPTGEGTGLGLSLSHDIIAQGHGGTLSVESQPGQGTTFTICLPVSPA